MTFFTGARPAYKPRTMLSRANAGAGLTICAAVTRTMCFVAVNSMLCYAGQTALELVGRIGAFAQRADKD